MDITGKTRLTGLLGRPVDHSISPLMHNEGFRQLGIPYVYLCFDIGEEEVADAVNGLKALGAAGWNCTMPDKNRMFELCDKLSPAAQLTGAVNTVVNEDGVLTGHMTDGVGYMAAVRFAGHDIIGKKMTLMGAGGAASAILVQAALDGLSEISVFSLRDQFFPRAEKIVSDLNEQTACKVRLFEIGDEVCLRREISESAILTNGTSVGMNPYPDRCVITDPSMLQPGLIVSDIIYNPDETKLLRMARERGCHAFNGLYMLLYQGAEAFLLWTGQEMPVSVVRDKYFHTS